MKNGIYALANVEHRVIDPSSSRIMFQGFESPPFIADGCSLTAAEVDRDAIHAQHDGRYMNLLLGAFDDPVQDARQLGIDSAGCPSLLAAAAHDRCGVDAATCLSGEWLLLRWDARARSLTLLMSECARDDCYFSLKGGRIAVAPELIRLAHLPWVDDDFDSDGLIRLLGRDHVRKTLGERTFLKGVMRLQPGTEATLGPSGVAIRTASALPSPPLSKIAFEEGVAAIEVRVRHVLRRRMARQANVAFLLSGGLDSSLLTCLGAEEARPGQQLHFLSSAAPAGSGLLDEIGWAQSVAEHVGVALIPVIPSAAADPYAPDKRTFSARESPVISPRHYLYQAFEDAAVARGAGIIVDGQFGELSLSSHAFFRDSPRRRLGELRRSLRDLSKAAMRRDDDAVDRDFHVRLAPALRSQVRDIEIGRVEPQRRLGAHEPMGLEPGALKVVHHSTAGSVSRTRFAYPFRDPRLLRLVAGYPAHFASHDGMPRAMVRAMLKGRVPDRIATRQCKMAFSPTYQAMLQRCAFAARGRIGSQRAAGADAWLDLVWLDRMLERTCAGEQLTVAQQFMVQGTAIAAEFFRWWRAQRGDTPDAS